MILPWSALAAGLALAGVAAPGLPVPPGATADQVAQGQKVFAATTCMACHGEDGMGGDMGPPLNEGAGMWTDGTLAGVREVIAKGVPEPRQFSGPMPPMGGVALSDADLAAVSAYVWAIGHQQR